MAAIRDKLRSLVEGLYLGSNNGSIKWSRFENSDSFYTEVDGGNIEIGKGQNARGEPVVLVTIYNGEGQKVDSFDDDYFKDLAPIYFHRGGYFEMMNDIIETARRSATGADQIIDSILRNIGAPKIDSDDPPF